MEKRLTKKEVIMKRRVMRRKAQVKKVISLLMAASIGALSTVAYITQAETTTKNYVPAERIVNADYKTLESYTAKVDRVYEIRKSTVENANSYIVKYADIFFYGEVVEIGSMGNETVVAFKCLESKRSNPIVVAFSGTVDLIPGDRVKVHGAYLNEVGDKAKLIEDVTIENPEDTIYISGDAIVAL